MDNVFKYTVFFLEITPKADIKQDIKELLRYVVILILVLYYLIFICLSDIRLKIPFKYILILSGNAWRARLFVLYCYQAITLSILHASLDNSVNML